MLRHPVVLYDVYDENVWNAALSSGSILVLSVLEPRIALARIIPRRSTGPCERTWNNALHRFDDIWCMCSTCGALQHIPCLFIYLHLFINFEINSVWPSQVFSSPLTEGHFPLTTGISCWICNVVKQPCKAHHQRGSLQGRWRKRPPQQVSKESKGQKDFNSKWV